MKSSVYSGAKTMTLHLAVVIYFQGLLHPVAFNDSDATPRNSDATSLVTVVRAHRPEAWCFSNIFLG